MSILDKTPQPDNTQSADEYDFEISAPASVFPDLDRLGIDEVDNGLCRDTIENRKILRREKLSWFPVYTREGEPTDLLQVISEEMYRNYKESRLEAKGDLLEDPRNLQSNYKTGLDLLLCDEAIAVTPAWVVASTKRWNLVEIAREEGRSKGTNPHLAGPPGRCNYLKSDGLRCANWHNGSKLTGGLCSVHENRPEAHRNLISKARHRITSSTIEAVDELERLMQGATSEPVRLKAATELLDRAGVRGGIEIDSNVEISVRPAAEIIAERLEKFRQVSKILPEITAEATEEDGEQ